MAERRMFTKKISDSDAFIELSSAAQALYFHLNQGADDDGFNNQVQNAMFKAHASIDDLKILMLKNFIIRFESGVIVIKHWRMHNTLRKDRYIPTSFQEELKQLGLKDNGSYTLGCQMVAERLSQDSIGENSGDSMYVDNIKNKNESNYNNAHAYVSVTLRTEKERQVYKAKWKEFFDYCYTDKYILASNTILDVIISTIDFIKNQGVLKFNSKIYNLENFETLLNSIDSEKLRHITMQVANSEDIKDVTGYIIGCLIKASESK